MTNYPPNPYEAKGSQSMQQSSKSEDDSKFKVPMLPPPPDAMSPQPPLPVVASDSRTPSGHNSNFTAQSEQPKKKRSRWDVS